MENVSGERFAAGELLLWLALNGEQWLLSTGHDNGWLLMENSGGFGRKTAMVSSRWRIASLGYRRRTRVVGFKWRTLMVSGLLQVNNCSGWIQMENSGGL